MLRFARARSRRARTRDARLRAPRTRARLVLAAEGDEGAGAAGRRAGGALAFEPKSKSKRKRRAGQDAPGITVEGAAIEAAREGDADDSERLEEAYILFLFAYVVVFLGGLVLAVSALASSRTVGQLGHRDAVPLVLPHRDRVLVFSSIYGLVKTETTRTPQSGSDYFKKRGGGLRRRAESAAGDLM